MRRNVECGSAGSDPGSKQFITDRASARVAFTGDDL